MVQLQNSTYLKMSQNQLLDYMKCLEQQSLNELTASQDEDTAEAMNSFVHRLLGEHLAVRTLLLLLDPLGGSP